MMNRLTGGLLIAGTLAIGLLSAGGREPAAQSAAAPGYVKTIRPSATMLYVPYESMVSQADAIFIGRPVDALAAYKPVISMHSDGVHIADYYTLRPVKVARVIKTNGTLDIKSGKTVALLERAVITTVSNQATRMISEDYEELLAHDKYIFFVRRTAAGETILFNGKFSKINLERPEKDEDQEKRAFKQRVLREFADTINAP